MRKSRSSIETGRVNQKLRTRAALLDAAAALLARGRTPTVDEAAAEARVSRATAYRYFPTRDDLLNETALHLDMAGADTGVREAFESLDDPADRADAAERGMHQVAFSNEAASRVLLKTSMEKWLAEGRSGSRTPLRQARRREWFEAALAPAGRSLGRERLDTLVSALCMLTGVEALVVLKDILGLGPRRARKVKSWAVRTLVREMMREAQAGKQARRRR